MLLDNKGHGLVLDELLRALRPGSQASLLSPALSLFAWDALRAQLARLEHTRLLLPGPGAVGGTLLGGPEEL